jgi:hypothetical protein
MGQAELHDATGELIIRSTFYFYGDASSPALSLQIANDIDILWNEPEADIIIHHKNYHIRFEIKGIHVPDLKPETVWYNDDPQLNFFRIEEYIEGNVSFVDAIGSNTGCLKLDNLLQTPTTIGHEYGHTLGCVHPKILDIRGGMEPAIMYPRGTICDPALQYDPHAQPGAPGGTINPAFRKVCLQDIKQIQLHKLDFDEKGFATVGEFSSIYHEK